LRRPDDQATDERAAHPVRSGDRAHRPDQARHQWISLWTRGDINGADGDDPGQNPLRQALLEGCWWKARQLHHPLRPARTTRCPQSTRPTTTAIKRSPTVEEIDGTN